MSIADIATIFGGLIAAAAFIAAVIVYLRSNIARGTIDLYREDNDALRKRIETLDSEKSALQSRVSTLEGAVVVLRDVVTQKDAIKRMERFARYLSKKEGYDYDARTP